MKRLVSLIFALTLLLTQTAGVAAYDLTADDGNTNWFNNSAIGDHDLDVCYQDALTFNNRLGLDIGMERLVDNTWSGFTMIGWGGDCTVANIKIISQNFGSCDPLMFATDKDGGFSVGGITINNACAWDWDGPPIDAGEYDAQFYIEHELGHLLGIHHVDNQPTVIMTFPGPCNSGTGTTDVPQDDRAGLRYIYGGLNSSGTTGPNQLTCGN